MHVWDMGIDNATWKGVIGIMMILTLAKTEGIHSSSVPPIDCANKIHFFSTKWFISAPSTETLWDNAPQWSFASLSWLGFVYVYYSCWSTDHHPVVCILKVLKTWDNEWLFDQDKSIDSNRNHWLTKRHKLHLHTTVYLRLRNLRPLLKTPKLSSVCFE